MNKLAIFALLTLAGCASVPPTNVHQPMSVRPAPRPDAAASNGAIFQASFSRPLFEDRRARNVGDTITIKITENTTASKKSNNKLDRTDKATFGANGNGSLTVNGLPGAGIMPRMGLDVKGTNNFEGKGDASANNVFTGNITVTVIDVYPNGNLLVSGEKQLAIGAEQEFVRISGVVNPSFVDAANSIDSSKVADARIEYKSAGQLGEGMMMGWMSRFFMNVMPF